MLLALLPLVLDSALAGSKFKSPDDKRNWHGASWGTSPGEDMKCQAGPLPDTKLCTRAAATGDRAIGPLTADAVNYYFLQDRLYRVEIALSSDEASADIASALQVTYGDATWDPREAKQVWRGDQVQIGLTRNPRKPGSTLTYEYAPLLSDLDQARARAGGDKFKALAAEL